MSDEPDDLPMGKLRVLVGKRGSEPTQLDFAVSRMAAARNGTLYLLEVVGASQSINGLRACLNANVTADFAIEDVRASSGNGGSGNIRTFYREPDHGYACYATHLGHGHHHALFLSRVPGFLPVVSDESIYNELKKPHLTTPILRSWIGPIADALKAGQKLEPLYCFNCQCALITATTDDLDRIVSAGVKDESMPMRELVTV
jgi:hypothetical protein